MIEPTEIIRSKRKSIALVVNNKGELIVRAPFYVSEQKIMDFVLCKQKWIESKILKVQKFDEKYSEITMSDGDFIFFLGDKYPINLKNDINTVFLDSDKIYVPDTDSSKELLADWLKEQALTVISQRVKKYESVMQVCCNSVKISNAKSRWGCCTSSNNVNFTWRLIMCPLTVIDYVVVHELSHITHKNHSRLFWCRVESFLPLYRQEENWLKQNSKLMDII